MTSETEKLCDLASGRWAEGRPDLALCLALRAIRLAPGDLTAHYLAINSIWLAHAQGIETLLQAWAHAVAPGLSIEAASEFLLDRFSDAPARYSLFAPLATLEFLRGNPVRAETLFGAGLETNLAPSTPDATAEDQIRAIDYEQAPHHLETAAAFLDATESWLEGRQGLVIVDIACGTGALASRLRPRASRLIGNDISPAMVEIARPRYDAMKQGDMVAILKGMEEIADVVTCAGAAYYLPDAAPLLAAAAGALRPGGQLIMTDYPAPEEMGPMVTCGGNRRHCRPPNLLRRLAAEAGLNEIGFVHALSYALPARIWCFAKAV